MHSNASENEKKFKFSLVNPPIHSESRSRHPKLEVLFPLVRELNIDSRLIFYPEMLNEAPWLNRVRILVDGCSEEEAEALYPAIEAIVRALRTKDSK